jgi:TatD DNase family protein
MPVIIDSHCHIDFNDFDADRNEVIQRAQQLGVEKIIVPGVQRTRWDRVRDCCDAYPALYPCYGLHPYFIAEHHRDDIDALARYIEQHRPVAIGECGLDFFLKQLDREQQHFYFEQQLDIALQADLPVVIHARKSSEAVIDAIKQRPGLRGMIHSYSGSYQQAVKLIDLGFYLSFGGPVTFEKSTRLRGLVSQLPLDSILVETDAPDQPGQMANGQRNEPAFIAEVVEQIAQLHHTDINRVAAITTENAKALFQLV